ncbi:hypothetical protein [Mesorhizobium sp. M4B.F.Ca.ET.143.01.1.1]|uniref:hypothetical protein n=1 Tax=Mesorhizobium sp. M4B.F.Ca.ET.143.01.1.1 TaxID=2563947 RepID=UPI001AEEB0CD|nr:hypothetical protein [Mesorhizobium sp. M4B.F.Ca.ET.143.01.1.1]
MSVATTLKRSKGGQFALHAKALPGNPSHEAFRVKGYFQGGMGLSLFTVSMV